MKISTLLTILIFCLCAAFRPWPGPEPPPENNEPPEASATATSDSQETPPGVVSQIIHKLTFPASTISEALTGILNRAAEKEGKNIQAEIDAWGGRIAEVIQAPADGQYRSVAQSSLPVAAALAPALFMLRLALYHWTRLVGEQDSALRVIGDWIVAGVFAVGAGPLLDLLVRLGWWISGRILGETSALARDFFASTSLGEIALAAGSSTLFAPVLAIAMAIGALVAMAGMMFAFAAAAAALYLLAVLAAPLGVAGVIPSFRWLRGMWLKALALVCLVPIVAGAIFKAGVSVGYTFLNFSGLLGGLVRLMWFWGAAGLMIGLAGVLGKLTISSGMEAAGKVVGGVKAVAGTAALAVAGAGALGAVGSGAAAGSSTASAGAPAASVGGSSPGLSSTTHLESALGHYQSAEVFSRQAGGFEAFGMRSQAGFLRSQAYGQQMKAQQDLLLDRIGRIADLGYPAGNIMAGGSGAPPASESVESAAYQIGVQPVVLSQALTASGGSLQDFREGLEILHEKGMAHGYALTAMLPSIPDEIGRLVGFYNQHREEADQAGDPVYFSALGAGSDLLTDLTGRGF